MVTGGEVRKEEEGVPPLSVEVRTSSTMPATFTSCSADDRTRKGRRSVSATAASRIMIPVPRLISYLMISRVYSMHIHTPSACSYKHQRATSNYQKELQKPSAIHLHPVSVAVSISTSNSHVARWQGRHTQMSPMLTPVGRYRKGRVGEPVEENKKTTTASRHFEGVDPVRYGE
jgi:hypothetical protein